MTILSGDKIEKLLWEGGYDFETKTGIDGFSYFEVQGPNFRVTISETWHDATDWYLDSETMMIEVQYAIGGTYDDYDPVTDELDLLARIETYGYE